MIALYLCQNRNCRHEWETSQKRNICDWCGCGGKVIDTRNDLFAQWDSIKNEKKVTKRHG